MADRSRASQTELLDAILAQLPTGATELQRRFVGQYFAKMPALGLERLAPAQAATLALAAWDFVQQRPNGEVKLRFREPAADSGEDSPVLEILNDDMPFLVDSVTAELQRHLVTPLRTLHPILHVKRDGAGTLIELGQAEESGCNKESLIHLQLPILPEGVTPASLEKDIRNVLGAVKLVVTDFTAMTERCAEIEASYQKEPAHFKEEEVAETVDFLRWLQAKNFIFMGYVEYDFFDAAGKEALTPVAGSELGLFKLGDPEMKPQGLEGLPPEVRHFAMLPQLVEITKSNRKSIVHRPVQMDYIGLKRFDARGRAIGERRFLGLYTSVVYYQSATDIPIIRRKISRVLAKANFDPASHDGKALRAILEFSPRDELFQMTEDDLLSYAIGVLAVEAQPDVHLFVRRDLFERFVSCMVFIPRDRFNTQLREHIQSELEKAFHGTVMAFYTQMTDSPLARAHIIIKTQPGKLPDIDYGTLRDRIAKVTYQWRDMLWQALADTHGDKQAATLFRSYENAFPQSYINVYDAQNAVFDIGRIREVIPAQKIAMELFPLKDAVTGDKELHLKLYNPQKQAALSDILPMLENMGFYVIDEHPYRVTPLGESDDEIWIRDFRLRAKDNSDIDIKALKGRLEEILRRVWDGSIGNDGFNQLALRGGLDWREITLLRAYSRYARQTQLPYSNSVLIDALARHPDITRCLVKLFEARFDLKNSSLTSKIPSPLEGEGRGGGKDSRSESVARTPPPNLPPQGGEEPTSVQEPILSEIDRLLGNVPSLEEDRILRRYRDLILATWRTNYYQRGSDGEPKDYLSFKLDSSMVPELPLPRPYAEIFVYSQRVEGIHLRGGQVARGGLRWSDRRDDYRTEVLGLMKAQMVKNAVIVPVGSKGGFVVKRPPVGGDRDAVLKEGVACYQTYLRGLLDITDNIVEDQIVPPKEVVRHDGDDPYLVVAADKGTASFSDYANAVSAEYNFWLGDAFASGGSVGYDHKAMGITAKGAWISVQRHFREMGRDTQEDDFTVIGIGDMSGDVFGNGMLLSEHIKLVGAFNHLHIFLDPDPDPAKSFAERQRLFALPRSGWNDYDPSLMSKGAILALRTDKTVKLTPEVQQLLGVEEAELSPDALIKAMLTAEIDLLWNGGIGTYVKAEAESHEQVGDRGNNALRVNGNQLRCKVVGEGGNLGFTQLGRIEYALGGGRLNTDAIDNSAGVDCSDHEVNIKIAFRKLLESGDLPVETRNRILESMTDEVARLVLRDNELQTQAISTAEAAGFNLLEPQVRMMQSFEKSHRLDRKVEYLPSDKGVAERRTAKQGLTRPELAVLLSYSKMALYQDLLSSNFPDEPYLIHDLMRYFPKPMREDFAGAIESHRLRREIIATVATNSLVNRAGITFFFQIQEDTGLPGCDIARAYTIGRDAFAMRDLWRDIESRADEIPADAQAAMYAQSSMFLERATLWLLRTLPQPLKIEETMQDFADGLAEYLAICDSLIHGTLRDAVEEKRQRFLDMQAPEDMARRIALLETALSGLDVVKIARDEDLDIALIGELYFRLGACLKLGWLRREANRMPTGSYWERLAAKSVINELSDQQRRLTATLLPHLKNGNAEAAVDAWKEANKKTVTRYQSFIEDLKSGGQLTFPMLTLALRNVEAIGKV